MKLGEYITQSESPRKKFLNTKTKNKKKKSSVSIKSDSCLVPNRRLMLVFATSATTHHRSAFSAPLPDRPPRYLSPNQMPVEEDTLQVFSKTKLYNKYFASLSLPNRKRQRSHPPTPPTLVPIRTSSAEIFSLFAMDDDAPAMEELVLQETP